MKTFVKGLIKYKYPICLSVVQVSFLIFIYEPVVIALKEYLGEPFWLAYVITFMVYINILIPSFYWIYRCVRVELWKSKNKVNYHRSMEKLVFDKCPCCFGSLEVNFSNVGHVTQACRGCGFCNQMVASIPTFLDNKPSGNYIKWSQYIQEAE